MCMPVYVMDVVYHVCAVPVEFRRGCQSPRKWS